MTPIALRRMLHWGHLMASLIIGTYLYSPLSSNAAFAAITLYGVFPAMAISGLWMWNQGRITHFFKGKSSA